MSLKWQDVINFKNGEKIILECQNVQHQLLVNDKCNVYPEDASKGLLILTNKRILFIVFVDTSLQINRPYLHLEIPYQQIRHFTYAKYEKRGGWFKAKKPEYALIIELKEVDFDDDSGFYKQKRFLLQSLSSLEEAVAMGKRALEIFEEEQKKEQELERRIEVVQYNIVAKFEFSKDGALAVSCPYCGASSTLQSKDVEVKCAYCGRVYIVPKKILDMI